MTLRVTFEIVPKDDEERSRCVGRLTIENQKDIGFDFAEYGGTFVTDDGQHSQAFEGIAHKRSDGFAHLTMMVLDHLAVKGMPGTTRAKKEKAA